MNIGLSYLPQIQGNAQSTGVDGTGAAATVQGLEQDGSPTTPTQAPETDVALNRRFGWIAQTFRQLVASVTSGYHTEHNTNDTHSTITATGSISERGRQTAIGDWTDIGFNALNFSGAGAMTWTVTSGQQTAFSYLLIGTTLYLNYWLDSTTIGGTTSTGLKVKLPANLLVGGYATAPTHYVNGTAAAGYVRAIPGDWFVTLYRADDSNWGSGALTVHGQLAVRVSDSSGSVSVSSVDPILTYTGGANNFTTTTTFGLTAAGTYTVTVNRPMTVVLYGVAGGGGGGTCDNNAGGNGGAGGGGGESLIAGIASTLVPGKTYTAVVGAAGVASGAGGLTSFVNTSDALTIFSLNGGGAGAANSAPAGAGGTGGTGAGRVAGGGGGTGNSGAGVAGTAAASGAGGGGGGGGSVPGAGANGGNGSATAGTGGAAAANGANNGGLAGGGGIGVGMTGGGGGGGGGAQIAGVTGAFGGGGGGGAWRTGTGGTALGGIVAFAFISAP